MWMYRINQLHSGCLDNLNIVKNDVDRLFVIDIYQFLMRIYILIVMRFYFLQGRI